MTYLIITYVILFSKNNYKKKKKKAYNKHSLIKLKGDNI